MIEPITLSGGAKLLSVIKTIATFGHSASVAQGGKYFNKRYSFYSTNPCSNFSTRKQSDDSQPIKELLEKTIIKEKDENFPRLFPYATNTFLPFTKEYILTSKKKTKPKEIDLANDFFDNLEYREKFKIRFYYADRKLSFQAISDDILDEDNIKSFFERLSSDPATLGTENKNILILGDIGTGKTTFFAKIMHDLAKSNQGYVPYKLPIQIDFEEIISINDRHHLALDEYCDNILKTIKNKINKAFDEYKKKDKTAQTSSTRAIIFIDNLDIVYQKFCEDYFVSETGHRFLDVLLKIVRKMQDRDFHEMSLMLFYGLREESIKALKQRTVGNERELKKLFSLRLGVEGKNEDETKEIIAKRLKLAVDALKKGSAEQNIIHLAEKNYNNFISNTRIDFRLLNNISSEGLRNTIDLFYRVSSSLFSKKVFHRFFIDSYYIKKLHFLGDNLIFTQAENGIFNIFLNNANYRYSEMGNLCEIGTLSDISSQKLCKLSEMRHLHTYWLKYFILVYLFSAKKSKNKQTPNIRDILDFFSPKNTYNTYEENLVRLVLLGLSESKHGKILDIQLSNNGDINTLELSDRGEYLLENIVWNFDYLSVIIEDYWLQFPTFMFDEEEAWMFNSEEGYCYESNEKVFYDKREISLKNKIKKIKLFLEILEISYKYEKKKIDPIFYKLNEIDEKLRNNNEQFGLPNFKYIKKRIYQQMYEYLKNCNITDITEKDLEKPILKFRKKRKYLRFFKENYGAMNKDIEVRRMYHMENQNQIAELNLNG